MSDAAIDTESISTSISPNDMKVEGTNMIEAQPKNLPQTIVQPEQSSQQIGESLTREQAQAMAAQAPVDESLMRAIGEINHAEPEVMITDEQRLNMVHQDNPDIAEASRHRTDASSPQDMQRGEIEGEAFAQNLASGVAAKHIPGQIDQDEIASQLKGTYQPQITHEPTPEEVASFDKAVETKSYHGREVLGEVAYEGNRALEVDYPELGKTITHVLGVKEAVGDMGVGRFAIKEGLNTAELKSYIEEQIRFRERDGSGITHDLIEEWVARLQVYDLDDHSFHEPAFLALSDVEKMAKKASKINEEKVKLETTIQARLYLARSEFALTAQNTDVFAECAIAWENHKIEFLEEFMENTPGVKEAVEGWETSFDDAHTAYGAMFRRAGSADILAADPHVLDAVGGDTKAAEMAVMLSKRLLKLHLMDGQYAGPVDESGKLIDQQIIDRNFPPGTDIDMRKEEYWKDWAGEHQKRIGRFPNGIITGETDPHFAHSISGLAKSVMYAPENVMELKVCPVGLTAAFETRVRSFAHFAGVRSFGELYRRRKELKDLEKLDYYGWGAIMVKNGGDLALKQFPTLYKEPLVFADDDLVFSDPKKAMQSVLKPILDLAGSFDYVQRYRYGIIGAGSEEPGKIKGRFLQEILGYVNTDEGRERLGLKKHDKFGVPKKWGGHQFYQAIEIARQKGFESNSEAKRLFNLFKTGKLQSSLSTGVPKAVGIFFELLQHAITSIAGK